MRRCLKRSGGGSPWRDGSVGKMHKHEKSNLHPYNQNKIQATRHVPVILALGYQSGSFRFSEILCRNK